MARPIFWMSLPIGLLSASLLHAQTAVPQAAPADRPGMEAAPAPDTGSNARPIPTIPESHIEPSTLSTPYEFLSVASSADSFVVRAAQLAEEKAVDETVRTLARDLATAHAASMEALQEAGRADAADIAEPSVDGEQQGLLGRLEQAEGEAFDAMFIEGQIFVHQRTIAYYRGYEGQESALGAYAGERLPALVAQYERLTAAAAALGNPDAAQTPATPQ